MPPSPRRRPPLPDLCLIAIFKQLTPTDQLKASLTSSHNLTLVRAANRRLKALLISDLDHSALQPAKPYMKLLAEADSVFFGSTCSFSQWNSLKLPHSGRKLAWSPQHTLACIFPAITLLKFTTFHGDHSETLIALLQDAQWRSQLTSLAIRHHHLFPSNCDPVDAINGLSALQYLSIDWDFISRETPHLPIIGQLKGLAIPLLPKYFSKVYRPFLERHTAGNADLQVHLIASGCEKIFTELASAGLSDSFRRSIVRLEERSPLTELTNVLAVCTHFPSLTSLAINCSAQKTRALFNVLSGLKQLTHLKLSLTFTRKRPERFEVLIRPRDQLPSVRALILTVSTASHEHLKWLNLQWTLPHLQVLILQDCKCFQCYCNINDAFNPELALTDAYRTALKCLRTTVANLNSGVHYGSIFIDENWNKYHTVEELLRTENDE